MSEEIQVTKVPGKNRYQVTVDENLAGYIGYEDTDIEGPDQRVINTTRVFEEFGGRGLAGILTKRAVEDAIDEGKQVVPLCPYVERWAEKNTQYADNVDAITDAHRENFSFEGKH